LDNIRFYILGSSILLSVVIGSWLRLHIASDQLLYIRLEQVFGLVAILYWYVALVVGPLGKLTGKGGVMAYLLFGRRAIGVSAAYFASLHAAIAFFGQTGGLGLLPDRFRWSLAFGTTALVILLIMAATSFDRVVRYMTFPRWKWLQRLVYAAGVLAVLHVWLTGTHIASVNTQIAVFAALAVLFGLEAVRITSTLAKRYTNLAQRELWFTLFLCVWLFWVGLLLILPKLAANYHSEHHMHTQERHHAHE
jgi:DMSO/TMAO reductase YedYZ heme-binding membrane subunit